MTEEEKEEIREEVPEEDKEAEKASDITRAKRIKRIRLALVLLLAFFCIAPTAVSFWAIHRMGKMNEELETIERMLLQLPAAGNGGEGRLTENSASAAADKKSERVSAEDTEGTQTGYAEQAEYPSEETEEEAAEEEAETVVKHVYLSFDDGPSIYTDEILDILADYGVKATFFVNGRNGFDAQYRRIVGEGHSIGMHSYSHVYETVYKDLDSFAEDLYQIQRLIYDKTGVDCRLYRFPGGSSNQVHSMDMKRCIQYLNAKDIRYFDWNVSGGDALPGTHSAEEITQTVLKQVGRTDEDTVVVLLHDSATKRSTVDALPAILEGLMAMDGVDILPIGDDTKCIQHIK